MEPLEAQDLVLLVAVAVLVESHQDQHGEVLEELVAVGVQQEQRGEMDLVLLKFLTGELAEPLVAT